MLPEYKALEEGEALDGRVRERQRKLYFFARRVDTSTGEVWKECADYIKRKTLFWPPSFISWGGDTQLGEGCKRASILCYEQEQLDG